MGIFSRFERVTHPPDDTAPPCTPEEVIEALLDLNGPDAPWTVRDGEPKEGADLVADWHCTDPAWRTYFYRVNDQSVLQTRMRLMPDEHQVRALDCYWQLGNSTGDIYTWGKGQYRYVSAAWELNRGPDGKRRFERLPRTDTADLKNHLRDTVLDMGWSWRARFSKL
ncbi:hypothetical protein [Streptomyces flavofungini]|uniref:hypothetical protein n=1 Tax=Streptomyces flavofungini TaxID=68200 RepID=UPI0025B022DF|nr:hypothetical protein [Streptomyces flavofungini]WJV48134.1 hypothetical protein QUY26_23005 [Streptomyces flavofungini]